MREIRLSGLGGRGSREAPPTLIGASPGGRVFLPATSFPTEGGLESPPSVRLKALMNSRVKVPDLADTEGPVTESNCIGAITPGGEQLEVND